MIGSLDRMWPQGCLQLSPEEEVRFTPVYRQMQEYIHTRSKENHHKAVLCMEELLGLLTEIYLREHGQPFVNSKMDIRNNDLQIQEVAAKCGFNDFSTFSRLFRKKTGLSPSQYRRNRPLP